VVGYADERIAVPSSEAMTTADGAVLYLAFYPLPSA
jgi:hypothetical protein